MKQFIATILDFIRSVITTALIGGGLLLLAGEIRLATLKKASNGVSKLSGFTEIMTDMKILRRN